MLFGWPFTQSERLHSNLPAPVRVMQSQDRLHRTLRSVPAFRDLRTGSADGWRSGSNLSLPVRESHTGVYQLTNFEPSRTRFDPTSTLLHQSGPSLRSQLSRETLNGEGESEALIESVNVAQPQLPLNSSLEKVTNQASQRSSIWKEIQLAVLWIYGSMLLILLSLAVLIAVYKVKPMKGLFFEPTGWNHARQNQYILLNVPASMNPHGYYARQ